MTRMGADLIRVDPHDPPDLRSIASSFLKLNSFDQLPNFHLHDIGHPAIHR